jgi:hypothetical protein
MLYMYVTHNANKVIRVTQQRCRFMAFQYTGDSKSTRSQAKSLDKTP